MLLERLPTFPDSARCSALLPRVADQPKTEVRNRALGRRGRRKGKPPLVLLNGEGPLVQAAGDSRSRAEIVAAPQMRWHIGSQVYTRRSNRGSCQQVTSSHIRILYRIKVSEMEHHPARSVGDSLEVAGGCLVLPFLLLSRGQVARRERQTVPTARHSCYRAALAAAVPPSSGQRAWWSSPAPAAAGQDAAEEQRRAAPLKFSGRKSVCGGDVQRRVEARRQRVCGSEPPEQRTSCQDRNRACA